MRPRSATLILFSIMALSGTTPATPLPAQEIQEVAEESLRRELTPKVQELAILLKDLDVTEVTYPQIIAPPDRRGGMEPGITAVFVAVFKEDKFLLKVKEATFISVRVEYEFGKIKNKDDQTEAALVMMVSVRDSRKEDKTPLLKKEWEFPSSHLMAKGSGVTIAIRDAKTVQEVGMQVLAAVRDKPAVHIDGAVVQPRKDALFGVEIRSEDKPILPTNKDGLAFVPFKPKQTFTVRLINNSDRELAASLSLDGISGFALATNKDTGLTHFLVPPKGHVDVPGWYRDDKVADQFVVAEFPKSVASLLGKGANPQVRTIVVEFSSCWERGKPAPADEPAGTKGADGYGIGRGASVPNPTKTVERVIGQPKGVVTLRYEVPR